MNTFLSRVLLTVGIAVTFNTSASESDGGIPYKWAPWKDPENPMILKMTDEKDVLFERRD
ncbi:hypothetical protein F9L16_22685 [Agarivorans sp. B2Z047]|uniref:hypothetical protein n=1 Tax=Agarivorans sp. B2Z047 TaxID=2652721 RepID=UPI00128D46E1|nr:hypothetical protein [Agarivorans sp. B2Z047]MPW31780.1 hypothetical protein [Agarivorans sp. B2Z047]UQN44842.1 hypothetical protein LQZ07_10370 [Agarivorans sp. B2Z047]